jgi:hypothetical protein
MLMPIYRKSSINLKPLFLASFCYYSKVADCFVVAVVAVSELVFGFSWAPVFVAWMRLIRWQDAGED